MEIQDFNQPGGGPAVPPEAAVPPPDVTVEPALPLQAREEAEIALLRARIEHLELVVETARSLMTANQERLLRRLHDLPQEMMALTATLNRLDPGRAARAADAHNVTPLQPRRAG